MPRRRRRSSSPIDNLQLEDDDDSINNDDSNSNKCPPQQRNAANARERARMRVLSKAFSRLKTTIPWVPADTKLSKLDTLRLASGYIAHLRALLSDRPLEEPNNGRPLNLTWPFNFQQNAQGSWSSECVSPERSNSPRIPPHTTGDSHHIASNNQSTQEEYYSPNNFYPRPENRFHNQQNNDYYDQIHRGSNGNSYGMVYND